MTHYIDASHRSVPILIYDAVMAGGTSLIMKFRLYLSSLNSLIVNRPDIELQKIQRRLVIAESMYLGDQVFIDRALEWGRIVAPVATDHEFKRLGTTGDGGYLVPLDLLKACQGAVSIGVGENNDIDVDIANYGIDVSAWDHTVAGLPKKHNRIKFYKCGLGGNRSNPMLKSLLEITEMSFPSVDKGLWLLLDAEGAEWDALASTTAGELERFDVLVIEFHNLGSLLTTQNSMIPVLEKLRSLFTPVVLTANNFGAVWTIGNREFPDVVEMTYIRNDVLKLSQTKIPHIFDSMNTTSTESISLSWVSEV